MKNNKRRIKINNRNANINSIRFLFSIFKSCNWCLKLFVFCKDLNIPIYINMLNKFIINIIKYRNNDMNIHNDKILDYIKKSEVVTSSEIAKLLKISWNTADSYLKELLIEGKVRRIKKEGVNLWMKK